MRGGDHIDGVVANWKRERPELDLSPVEIIGRAGRVMAYVDRSLETKFEEFGISRATFDVLSTLRRNGAPYRMTQRELMRNLLRTSGSMSLRIDALEREGLVSREPDETDRRSVYVHLSAKGVSLLDAIIPEHLANEKRLVAGLSAVDRSELVKLLRKWLVYLEEKMAEESQLYVGMTLLDARASLMKRRAVGLPDVEGLLVHAVEARSRAEDCGFRRGDLICAVQDQPVGSLLDLRKALNRQRPKVKVFRVLRGMEGEEIKL